MYNFNHDGSKFKLQIMDERYFVNESKRTITVTAHVRLLVPEFVTRTINWQQMPAGFQTLDLYPFGGVYGYDTIKMQWTSRCSPDDQWDVEKGKRIALAKLEANAYRRMSKSLKNWNAKFQEFTSTINDMCTQFVDKAEAAAAHDDRYIRDIA